MKESWLRRMASWWAMGTAAFAFPTAVCAVPQAGQNGLMIPGLTQGNSSVPWNIVILLTVLTLLPALLLAMTPFVRLLVVFHFLRQALGTQSTPTNQTLIGLALFLTYFIMQPVGADVYQAAIVPLQNNQITTVEAIDRGAEPLRRFMLKFARQKDLALFVELAKEPRPRRPEDLSMRVVIPAYILSELKAGFQIGTILFFPFLVIDLVVASITTSVGMMQLPPVVISTPLKILLFVMVDGWNLVVGSLMKSFY
jgi:flagellar biosynthetic protein FliP